MVSENNKNGNGYSYVEPIPEAASPELLFPRDVSEIMYRAVGSGSCIAEGGVGAGKSHLVQDIGKIARSSEYGLPTLTLRAHISGGSKNGASIAIRELDAFAESRREDGLIIVDNVDYYGYSGCKRKRSYPIAKEHVRVANYLSNLLHDEESPLIIGTAHDDFWRSQKWQFAARREDDEVTPAAQHLLDSFAVRHQFTGSLDAYTASRLLIANDFKEQEIESLVDTLIQEDRLTYRIVSRLQPETSGANIKDQIKTIQAGTARLMGLTAINTERELQLA